MGVGLTLGIDQGPHDVKGHRVGARLVFRHHAEVNDVQISGCGHEVPTIFVGSDDIMQPRVIREQRYGILRLQDKSRTV